MPKAKLLAQALGIHDHGQGNEALLVKSIERIRQLRDDIGLPADFADYPMTEEQFAATIQAVASDPAAISFPMPPELIRAIGERVVKLTVEKG